MRRTYGGAGQRWARTVSQDSAEHVQYHRTALGTYGIKRVHERTTLTPAPADGHNIFTQSKSMTKSERVEASMKDLFLGHDTVLCMLCQTRRQIIKFREC